MLDSTEYHIKGLILQVSNKGLVVQVREEMDHHNEHQLTDLPDWMFQSRSAIWLADGDNSLHDRALAGEEIKKKLLAEMPARINQNSWSQDIAFGKN